MLTNCKTIRQAVAAGGDYWANYLGGRFGAACVSNRIIGKDGEALRDEIRMDHCTKFGRDWQEYTREVL